MKKKLYSLSLINFSLIFGLIIIETIFNNKSIVTTINPVVLFLGLIIISILLVALYKFIDKKISNDISPKKELIIVICIFIAILVAQVLTATNLMAYTAWDWNDILNNARLYANGNDGKPIISTWKK